MPKALFISYQATSQFLTPVDKWIKNVYSLRTQTGTTSDQLHTGSLLSRQFLRKTVDNSYVTPLLVQVFTPLLSTSKNTHFNPLHRHLYPQSTAPINKKKREKMERNT